MPNIIILDEETANQIAAGEVVDRPVSVVKELVENSLDAGATSLEIDLYEGGLTSITVIDNGIGMSEEDAVLAFNRHATSKIKKADDLYNILTLGFRGEALPSIAAVSRVLLKTKTQNSVRGIQLELSGGKVLSKGGVGCPPGTSVTVSDLFFNTPARFKHMKSSSVEAGRISDLINRISMAIPGVSFRLRHNNKVVFHAPGTGNLLDAVSAVYGIKNARDMLYLHAEDSIISLSGYISKPTLNRANRKQQTIFINNRLIKSSLIQSSVEEAYRTLLPNGRYPLVVLSLHVNPEKVDVNVHPAKLEVRLEQENEIAEFIKKAIKKELQNHSLVPELELKPSKNHILNVQTKPQQEKFNFMMYPEIYNSVNEKVPTEISPKTTPIVLEEDNNIEQLRNKTGKEKENLISKDKNYCNFDNTIGINEKSMEYNQNSKFPSLWPLAQLMPTYILASGDDGLFIIDQHAAHERVLFEKYLKQLNEGYNSSQLLLVPVTLDLDFKETELLIKHIVLFKEIGFIVEEFGGSTFILRGVPGNVLPGQEKELFLDVLDFVEDSLPGREIINERLASSMACKAAIKSKEKLTITAMKALIEQLAESKSPFTCPHGRPTLIHLSYDKLARKFMRN